MDVVSSFQTLGISLGLGLLVGAQREKVDAPLAGVRTFALITLFGTLCALLALTLGAWVVAAGLLAVASATAMGNVVFLRQERADAGITTEIAILLMFGIGAYLVLGHREVAVVLGGGVALLLHAKPIMHGFVRRLGEADMRVLMQLVLITLVILPLLPDRPFGPFEVLNPREIWWMVVLVVGIGLCSYVALKLYGARTGILLAGVIGGVISSTATTVSVARRTSENPGQVAAATVVILLASTVVYVRVLVEIAVVAQPILGRMAPPIVILLAATILLCVALWWRTEKGDLPSPPNDHPTELGPALLFGVLYAIVLLAVVAARHYFGDRGVYLAAGISGLTDMDAITLSTSRMSASGLLASSAAWRSIVLAILSNLAFKAVLVGLLGGWALARRVGALFAVQIAIGLVLLAAWPG